MIVSDVEHTTVYKITYIYTKHSINHSAMHKHTLNNIPQDLTIYYYYINMTI